MVTTNQAKAKHLLYTAKKIGASMPASDRATWFKGMQKHAQRVGHGYSHDNEDFFGREDQRLLAAAIINPIYNGNIIDEAFYPYWYNQYNYLWSPYYYWNYPTYTYNQWLRYTQPLYPLGYTFF